MIQAAAAIPDVGDVEHHVVGELTLERQRPVLEARQRQAVRRHGQHVAAVGERRIDERRLRTSGLREPVVQIEAPGCWPLVSVRREQVRLEAERRLADELIERDAGVVDAVAAADRVLLAEAIGEADARPPRILRRVLELPRARSGPRPSPAKISAPGMSPAAGLGVFGSNVEY